MNEIRGIISTDIIPARAKRSRILPEATMNEIHGIINWRKDMDTDESNKPNGLNSKYVKEQVCLRQKPFKFGNILN